MSEHDVHHREKVARAIYGRSDAQWEALPLRVILGYREAADRVLDLLATRPSQDAAGDAGRET